MNKVLVFKRTMMQRYRAISHLIDPLIEDGYHLWIEVQSDKKKFDIKTVQDMPMNASRASEGSVKYLVKNFDIPCRHFEKVNFTTLKSKIEGLFLTVDNRTYEHDYVALPYNGFHCRDGKNKVF